MWSPNTLWLLAALLLQGGLALGILVYLGVMRVPLVMRGEVHLGEIAVSRSGWPERVQQVANAADNQFQLPLLLYVAVFISLYLGPSSLEVVLAWGFVVSRYIHAGIHLSDNHVIRRFFAFVAGSVFLGLFWADLLVRVVLSALGAA